MSDEVFTTTCHETAHTTHAITMNAGPIQFIQVSNQIQESWAVALSWFVSHIEYEDRGIANYGQENYSPLNPPRRPSQYGYQYWSSSINGNTYTNLFIDIVDNVNELNHIYPGRATGSVDDRVFGYTLPLIEDKILKHSYGLTSLSNELKSNLPIGVTNSDIDLLLSHY